MALIVNGERIEDAYLVQVQEQLEAQRPKDGSPPEWEQKGIGLDVFATNMALAQVLVRQEARRNGPAIPRKDVVREIDRLKKMNGGEDAFQKALEEAGQTEEAVYVDIEMGMKVDALLDQACKDLAPPSEEELLRYYEANIDSFMSPERVRASHIVKYASGNVLDLQAAHQEMKQVLGLIQQGMSFELMAARHSDCPDNAGDLGYFTRGVMTPEFEEVVFNLKKGEMSGIFQTPFGLHIAKVTDHVPAKPRTFEEAKDDVKRILLAERENAAVDAYTDTLREKATIETVQDEMPA